jgi:hypothetical protein
MNTLKSAIIIAVAMIVSSLILSYSMRKLGRDIFAAGIHISRISLENANNGGPLRIVLDAKSAVQIKPESDPGN